MFVLVESLDQCNLLVILSMQIVRRLGSIGVWRKMLNIIEPVLTGLIIFCYHHLKDELMKTSLSMGCINRILEIHNGHRALLA